MWIGVFFFMSVQGVFKQICKYPQGVIPLDTPCEVPVVLWAADRGGLRAFTPPCLASRPARRLE